MTWIPISNNLLKRQLESKTTEIAEALLKIPIQDIESISLMSGRTGIALFLFYYARYSGDKKCNHQAQLLISSIFDEINSGKTYYTFAGGLAGIGWTINHLNQYKLFETYNDDPLYDIDQFLYNMMMMEIRSGNYDYLHGALGIGVCFLKVLNEKRNRSLKKLTIELEKNSCKTANGGICWSSAMTSDTDQRGYNLGLSHGIASIIAFLTKVFLSNIEIQRTSELLSGAVSFLFQHIQDPAKNLSYFPNWVEKKSSPGSSRLAWCYGDLGIASAIFAAAKATSNKDWEEKAIEILKYSTSRIDLKENAVTDAALCHGTAGIAHIYNRLHNYTKIIDFQGSAEYWFDESLKMAKFFNGIAGYLSPNFDTNTNYVNQAGLLEGATGIGLAMLAAISDVEPSWDEALLLS